MIAIIPIAFVAGAASTLMFASIISGALISVLLLFLAPLPLMMAALGWGPLCAAIGGAAATTGLGIIFGPSYCTAFAVGIALPAWWLGYLSLLGRPAAANNPTAANSAALEWYPAGRILLWIGLFAVIITTGALLTLGSDAPTITETMRGSVTTLLQGVGAVPTEREVEALIAIAPISAAIVTMMTLTLNLWLAAKITAASGRLHRPWPDLKSTALPPMALVALCAAIAFCFSGGLLAILAQIITASLMVAYALTGFAVLHTLALARKHRILWLGCAYAAVLIFSWLLLVMAILGVADAIFGIRQRFLQRRPPPLPAS